MSLETDPYRLANENPIRRGVAILVLTFSAVSASLGEVSFANAQEAASSECVLKTVQLDCTVKPGEVIRVLDPHTTVEREITGRERHLFRFGLSSGQFIRSVVDQRGIDLKVSICTQDGKPLSEVDRQSGSWGPEAISLVTKTAEEYLLQVKPLADTGTGRYELKINEIRNSAPIDEVRVNAERIVTEGGKFYSQGGPACLRESITRYDQALRLWQSLGETEESAITLYGLGWSYSDLGAQGMVKFPTPRHRLRWNYGSHADHLTALKYFQQGLDIMQASGNQYGEAIALAGIAWPNLYLGRSEEALKSFSEAGRLFHVLDNRRGEAISTYGLGWAHALLNDNQKALDSFSRALLLRRQVGDRKGEASTLAALSRIYNRLGQNTEALAHGKQALMAYESVDDSRGQASTHSTLGWIYNKLGRQAEALESFQKSLKLQRPSDDTGRANTLYGIAQVQNDLGNIDNAVSGMEDVLRIIEPLRAWGGASDLRTYYFANVQEYYDFYIELLMRMHRLYPEDGHAANALGASERARARDLLAVLAESAEAHPPAYDDALTKPLDATGVKNLLDDQTVLLEYFLGDERSYLWLVTSDEVGVYDLPKRSEIETKAVQLYELLTERNRKAPTVTEIAWKHLITRLDLQAEKVAADLGQTLLQPVMKRLENKRVVIVPHGALQLIPMGALPVLHPKTKILTPFFVDHETVNLPSFSVLTFLRRNRKQAYRSRKTIAVIADPVFTSDDPRVRSAEVSARPTEAAAIDALYTVAPTRQTGGDSGSDLGGKAGPEKQYQRLLGARWEAQQIISLVPKEDAFSAFDFAASRHMAMSDTMNDFRIIHFATHAFADDVNPSRSKIVLSRFNEKGELQNGNLTLSDVNKLKLRASLVVLSACETGLGVDTKGEGLIGLTGGFMHAGVSRVLVSLWPISDRAAADFMAKFYRRVLGPRKLSPSAALREVQIETWKDGRWKSAYFWAPFILNGEWGWE